MKIAMLVDNNFTIDQRIIQEVRCISSMGDSLIVYALYDNSLPAEERKENYSIKRIFSKNILSIKNKAALSEALHELSKESFDVIHCHDHYMLQLGTLYKKRFPKCKLIYDSHELFKSWPINMKEGLGLGLKVKTKMARYIDIRREKADAKQIDFLITVNDSIAKILYKYFRLKNYPVVLRNVMEFEEIKEKSDALRQEFKISNDAKILVFIGSHIYRKKMNMESSFLQLSTIQDLVLVIITADDFERKYFETFVEKREIKNIFFKDVIYPKDFLRIVGSADAGLMPTWNKKSLSYWLALDSKLFIYIMCELPVLSMAQPEYIDVVEKYKIGVCVNGDEPDCYKKGWVELLKNYPDEKKNVNTLKHELNWNKEQEKLKELYNRIKMDYVK